MSTRLHYSMVSSFTRNGIRRVVRAARVPGGLVYREDWYEEGGAPAEYIGGGEWKGGTTWTITRTLFGTSHDGCQLATEEEAMATLQHVSA